MSNYLLVTSRFTELMVPGFSAAALTGEIPFCPFDQVQLSARAKVEESLTFIIPVAGFETLMAKAMAVDGCSAPAICEEIMRTAFDVIAFFEELHSRVKLVDIEEVVASFGSQQPTLREPAHWQMSLERLLSDCVLPGALARLGWMERRSAFGSHVERAFDTLEACRTPVATSQSHGFEGVSTTGVANRRYQLIEEAEREIANQHTEWGEKEKDLLQQLASLKSEVSEAKALHANALAEMESARDSEVTKQEVEQLVAKNSELQQALEQATISQEISDLMITQLQEELELAISDQLAGDRDAEDEADHTQVEAPTGVTKEKPQPASEMISPTKEQATGKSRHTFKRWALNTFMAPATRARINQLRASELFDPDWYVAIYPDIADSAMSPEYHFLKFGAAEYRDPSPKFSTQRYLWQHPEIDVSRENPLLHFLRGAKNK